MVKDEIWDKEFKRIVLRWGDDVEVPNTVLQQHEQQHTADSESITEGRNVTTTGVQPPPPELESEPSPMLQLFVVRLYNLDPDTKLRLIPKGIKIRIKVHKEYCSYKNNECEDQAPPPPPPTTGAAANDHSSSVLSSATSSTPLPQTPAQPPQTPAQPPLPPLPIATVATALTPPPVAAAAIVVDSAISIESVVSVVGLGQPPVAKALRKAVVEAAYTRMHSLASQTVPQGTSIHYVYEAIKFIERHLSDLATEHTSTTAADATTTITTTDGTTADVAATATHLKPHEASDREESDFSSHSSPVAGGDTLNSDKVEWTAGEQRRLEVALEKCRKIEDPKLKWTSIGKRVGTRSAKQCVNRYLACRYHTQQAQGTSKSRTSSSHSSLSSVEAPQTVEEKVVRTEPAASTTTGVQLSLILPEARGLGIFRIARCKLQVACGRCKEKCDITLGISAMGKGGDVVAKQEAVCARCHEQYSVSMTAGLAHLQNPIVARVTFTNCRYCDFLPSNFIVSCEHCSDNAQFKDMGVGDLRSEVCRKCFNRMTFGHCGVDRSRFALPMDQQDINSSTAASKSQQAAAKKKTKVDDRIMKLGNPLPKHGACQHYKKSFRWLRFPCCKKVYPCDICHNDDSDHICEWANRMICGYCCKEQPYSPTKMCTCGHSLTAGATAHWEGGKGNRNWVTMSNKDSHKAKLRSKQSSKK